MRFPVTEHVVKTARHTSFYLACGAEQAPHIVFVHGWPELSISWRHQLQCFASLGFRAIAPDMRGYGRSTVHPQIADYGMEQITADMIELLDGLGVQSAIWVGHDWGSPVVWSLAQHHAQRVAGVASLCVPYLPDGFSPEHLIPLIDRTLYPADVHPAGQWDYQLFYREHFDRAVATFEADVLRTVKVLFRKGDPAGRGKPARLAFVRREGGWFGGASVAPDLPMDRDLLTQEDLHRYVSALQTNGFFGPDAWYMNADANMAFAARAAGDRHLDMPVLFFHAAYDYTCDTVDTALPEPMRAACRDLTELTVPTGHWMAQERPELVNAGLARWLALKFPQHWAV
ncbi:MAG: alpha/beta hydrolase [Burkholderiales bacterium]|nr:alpha/beta hydrolase [Burkholderiales bacterium]